MERILTLENAKTVSDFSALIYNRKHEDFREFTRYTEIALEKYRKVKQM